MPGHKTIWFPFPSSLVRELPAHRWLALIFCLFLSLHLFAQPTVVCNAPGEQSETFIAVNPVNHLQVVATWNDFRILAGIPDVPDDTIPNESKAGYGISTDGGLTWRHDVLTFPFTYPNAYDPGCAFDRHGNIYYSFIRSMGLNAFGAATLARTSDLGKTWSRCNFGNSSNTNDKPYLAVDNTGGPYDGRIYLAWLDVLGSGKTRIAFAFDTTRGIKPEPLQYLVTGMQTTPFPTITIGPRGEVYVFWLDENVHRLRLRKSLDGGVTFSDSTLCNLPVADRTYYVDGYIFGHGGAKVHSYASCAVDTNTGNLYVAYTDNFGDEYYPFFGIQFTRSTDGGEHWDTPYRIADSMGGCQFMPWLGVDPGGRISVCYVRDTLQSFGRPDSIFTVYCVNSYNEGLSFEGPVMISDGSYNDMKNGRIYYDYIGMAASAGTIFPTWVQSTGEPGTQGDVRCSRVMFAPNRLPADNSAAMANSNTPKEVYCSAEKTWYAIFNDHGNVYSMHSFDQGATWIRTAMLNAGAGQVTETGNPSIVQDRFCAIHAMFATTTGLWIAEKPLKKPWSAPACVYSSSFVSYPAFVIDSLNTAHILFSSYLENAETLRVNGAGKPKRTYFLVSASLSLLTDPPGAVVPVDTVWNGSYPVIGTTMVKGAAFFHAAWQFGFQNYYARRPYTGRWGTPEEVTPSQGSLGAPGLVVYHGDTVAIAWEDSSTGRSEILYWSRVDQYTGTLSIVTHDDVDARDPCLGLFDGKPLLLWAENTGSLERLRYFTPGQPIHTVPGTFYTAYNPGFIQQPGKNSLLMLWTEQDGDMFRIASARVDSPGAATSVSERDIEIPVRVTLNAGYPNPFNSSTMISYRLDRTQTISLKIVDVLGREVQSLFEGREIAGDHAVRFDGSKFASGVYFCTLRSANIIAVTKLLLMK